VNGLVMDHRVISLVDALAQILAGLDVGRFGDRRFALAPLLQHGAPTADTRMEVNQGGLGRLR